MPLSLFHFTAASGVLRGLALLTTAETSARPASQPRATPGGCSAIGRTFGRSLDERQERQQQRQRRRRRRQREQQHEGAAHLPALGAPLLPRHVVALPQPLLAAASGLAVRKSNEGPAARRPRPRSEAVESRGRQHVPPLL